MSTKIGWCDETLNVFTGCTPISEACQNCYAKTMANRLKGRYGYPKDNPFKPTYHSDRMLKIRKKLKSWKKPRKIFHVSMGDIFHDDFKKGVVPWEKVYTLFWNIRGFEHTHIFLTKRPQNAVEFIKMWFRPDELPLKNVWFGVTVENYKNLGRIDHLLKINAEILFISCEPLLSFMDIEKYLRQPETKDGVERSLIDWVVAGPETGPRARSCPDGAILDLAEQCFENDVPFFDKREDYIAREFPA